MVIDAYLHIDGSWIRMYIPQLLLPAGQGGEGCELTKELYRWDQRLFTVVLRLPGVGGASATYNESNHLSQSSIYALCEATGGMCFCGVCVCVVHVRVCSACGCV